MASLSAPPVGSPMILRRFPQETRSLEGFGAPAVFEAGQTFRPRPLCAAVSPFHRRDVRTPEAFGASSQSRRPVQSPWRPFGPVLHKRAPEAKDRKDDAPFINSFLFIDQA